jgi:hypothetical protein
VFDGRGGAPPCPETSDVHPRIRRARTTLASIKTLPFGALRAEFATDGPLSLGDWCEFLAKSNPTRYFSPDASPKKAKWSNPIFRRDDSHQHSDDLPVGISMPIRTMKLRPNRVLNWARRRRWRC